MSVTGRAMVVVDSDTMVVTDTRDGEVISCPDNVTRSAGDSRQ